MKPKLQHKNQWKKVLMAVTFLGLVFAVLYFATSPSEPVLPSPLLVKINKTIALVTAYHVDKKNPDDLIQNAFKGMVAGLDEGSEYLSPYEYGQLKIGADGGYAGIGVQLSKKNGYPVIEQVLGASPASEAGLKKGDRIIVVDGRDAGRISLGDTVRLLHDVEGSKVALLIHRENYPARGREFTLTRRHVTRSSLGLSFVSKGIGYLQCFDFSNMTTAMLKESIETLDKKEKLKGFILDLRSNGGGVLDAAIDTAKLFLDKDKLITKTKGRRKSDDQKFKTKEKGLFAELPVVILTDSATASSAEVLTAALRDNNRAFIVGERTYGKASVQTVFPLEDGSALRVTTAYYYTPAGTLIQNNGIIPDILQSVRDGKLPHSESNVMRDPVYKAAAETIKKQLEQRAL